MHRTKFLACVVLAFAEWVQAQGPVASLVGYWEGTLDTGAGKLRLALHATKAGDGLYLGELVSVDQGNAEIPIGKAAVDGRSVTLEFPLVSGTFKGVEHVWFAANGNVVAGGASATDLQANWQRGGG